ncbi:response regulator [Candidatus Daviesbacteria bacterium]|nr:response regulator [Candidatus Daviesbacteria bacterium]
MAGQTSILLIEDEKTMAELYKTTLELAGFKVTLAIDGKVALARALHEPYDMIILDLMLPLVNGMDVLKVLGEKGILPKTPVVVFTNLPDELEEAKKLGAREYFIKAEMTPDQLVEQVKKILAKP